ncbi:MAG: hypothetical protein HKN35_10795, partial [Woeseia sp.]|nr:hypothetical protein [Woeseia sp.]
YWPQVYEHAIHIAAQILFAYAIDMLICWTRREKYFLGFGPFPIIFSTNLFLWFRDDWFYLQFLMIAVGFLGKEFVVWSREGKRTHIFNPSAFSLGLFSLVLIITDTTNLTWGEQIATTLSLAPHIYLMIFLLGLVVMYSFSTTLVSSISAATLFALSAIYFDRTGVPYFLDSEIPIAVFLGLHLLVTDPSTSPRTPFGKAIFGLLYGAGVFVLYELLDFFGSPTFYDKLLCVPLLNLSVQLIDRLVRTRMATDWAERLKLVTATKRSNMVHMAIWIAFFSWMSLLGSTDGQHTGDSVPFWQQACADDRRRACERLLLIEGGYCRSNVGWACNEMGIHYAEGKIANADLVLSRSFFERSCRTGFWDGCVNLRRLQRGMGVDTLTHQPPRVADLRGLLRQGGLTLVDMPEAELLARACDHGWEFACADETGAFSAGAAKAQ